MIRWIKTLGLPVLAGYLIILGIEAGLEKDEFTAATSIIFGLAVLWFWNLIDVRKDDSLRRSRPW